MAAEKGGKTTWKSFLFAHEDVDIFRDTPIRYLGDFIDNVFVLGYIFLYLS